VDREGNPLGSSCLTNTLANRQCVKRHSGAALSLLWDDRIEHLEVSFKGPPRDCGRAPGRDVTRTRITDAGRVALKQAAAGRE
jgi:hypothetical protein